MKSLKDIILENIQEAKTGRANRGRLENIDKLLSWMYEKDILNKGEKSKKDTLFYQYYRFYNDGDIPKGLKDDKGVTFTKYSNRERVANALESKLEEFIRKILSKYISKIDRSDYRLDQAIKDIEIPISVVGRHDVDALVTYWHKNIKDPEVLDMIKSLESEYNKLREITDKANDSYPWEGTWSNPNPKSIIMVPAVRMMKDAGIWTTDMERRWVSIKKAMDLIGTKLENIKTSLKELKKLKAVS